MARPWFRQSLTTRLDQALPCDVYVNKTTDAVLKKIRFLIFSNKGQIYQKNRLRSRLFDGHPGQDIEGFNARVEPCLQIKNDGFIRFHLHNRTIEPGGNGKHPVRRE
jgi:hypothetical protein